MMTRNFAILLGIIILALSAGLAACGSSSENSATSPEETSVSSALQDVTPEMLQDMVPGVDGLPGFTRSDARLLDNQGASTQAPDPAARVAHLDAIGRIVGFHALFAPTQAAPADAPDSITWSVNLFKEPSGALEFINEPLDTSEGVIVEPLDVSSLGVDAVGFLVRNSDPAKTATGYVVAFVEDSLEAGVTATYSRGNPSPDYILDLARQAQGLVESVLDGESAPEAPSS